MSKDASAIVEDGVNVATTAQNVSIEEENEDDIEDPAISFTERKTDNLWDRKGSNERHEVIISFYFISLRR